MRRRLARTLSVIGAAVLVAACAGAAPGGTPSPAPVVDPTPVIAPPSPGPDGGTYWLRLTTVQAIPPVNLFARSPTALITGDWQYLAHGATPASFPGPLAAPLFARQVSERGREQILAWADELGMLAGEADFTGELGPPGGITGRIELTVDGQRVTLTGVPDVPTSTEPGTPGAWAELWRRLATLPETLAPELGPERPYTPSAYAILVGPAPQSEEGLDGGIAVWPLDVTASAFGVPVQDGSYRCGVVDGEDAARLQPVLEGANQLTQWVPGPAASATFGLTVRVIAAGEDPCAEAFGS